VVEQSNFMPHSTTQKPRWKIYPTDNVTLRQSLLRERVWLRHSKSPP